LQEFCPLHPCFSIAGAAPPDAEIADGSAALGSLFAQPATPDRIPATAAIRNVFERFIGLLLECAARDGPRSRELRLGKRDSFNSVPRILWSGLERSGDETQETSPE
jgi:hypothetical protein